MSDKLSDEELRARVELLRRAVLNEGVYLPPHRRLVERLRQERPILYRAIMGLANLWNLVRFR